MTPLGVWSLIKNKQTDWMWFFTSLIVSPNINFFVVATFIRSDMNVAETQLKCMKGVVIGDSNRSSTMNYYTYINIQSHIYSSLHDPNTKLLQIIEYIP